MPVLASSPVPTLLSPRRRLARALRAWDRQVFRETAARQSAVADVALKALTRTADFSLLWIGIGGGLLATRRRATHRAARRGLVSIAAASLLANQVGKRAAPRSRPPVALVPVARVASRVPTSSSFPSGHAASAAAFAGGVGLAEPVLALPLAGLAAAVAYSRVYTGVHYPSDVLAGLALGAAVAVVGHRIAPVRTPSPLRIVTPRPDPQPPRADGQGVVAVVNARAGGGRGALLAAEVTRELPAAEVVVVQSGDDLDAQLRAAAAGAGVLAVGGGDGTVSTAAGVAMETGLPLLVLPGGTFNHFAADLGLVGAADAIEALRSGTAIKIDVGAVCDQPDGEIAPDSGRPEADGASSNRIFLNTASLGSYPSFVAVRERWESRLGKRAAAVLALLVVLRTEKPLRAVVAGREVLLALMFVGNGRYQPHGFAPSWRPRLDDGVLDVRLVLAGHRFTVLRLAASLALGRLGRSRLYVEGSAVDLPVALLDGPRLLARDGEVSQGPARMLFAVVRHSLTVYQPQRRTFL